MYQNQIKNVRRDKHDGKLYCEFDNKPDEVFLDIRTGLCWPYQTRPGYWILLGEYEKENVSGQRPLALLDEGKAKDLDKLFDSMTDSAVRLKSEGVYANMGEENYCYRDSFARYCEEGNIRRVFLKPAPYVGNFEWGINLIRQLLRDNALEVDQSSIIARQLGQIPESALEEEQKDEYYAIQALRFAAASYAKSPWRPPLRDIDYGPLENYPGWYKGIEI